MSTEKWLRIHNGQEWPDYYDEANVEDLRRFFDHYLKGMDNGWEQTPRVRVSARHLDATRSTDAVPAHSFDRVAKLAPGEIAAIEIDLLPIGLAFHPGEQLRFIIGARNSSGR